MKFSSFNSKALAANYIVWTVFISVSLYASIIDSTRAGREVEILVRTSGYLISFVPWMLLTPVFYLFIQKQQNKPTFSIVKTLLVLLIIWAPLAMFFETRSVIVLRKLVEPSPLSVLINLPLFYWVYHLLLFGVTLAVCFSLLYYRRSNINKQEVIQAQQQNLELQLQLGQLRIQSLQNQLEPHFLFNALNAIASLVRMTEKKMALTAIKQLSDLLRYAVDASKQQFVHLNEEINFVNDYLALQQLRFEGKLMVEIDDLRTNHEQQCPPFVLQIFVENAIRHGLEASGETMQMSIKIVERDNRLSIDVVNSHGQDKLTKQKGLGIGLENLKARLEILYSNNYSLNSAETENIYTSQLSIPSQSNQHE